MKLTNHDQLNAIDALAQLHHDWLLGLQLAIASRLGPVDTGEWSFRLFRRQHHRQFLAGLAKLGLDHLPDAIACAQYHVLANSMGGVGVEYLAESERKAWVRFRYPRWLYAGPTLCGIPPEVGRGFLRGWYAHNGVSLNNPRLGFVCVSEDLTGEFGLCGYFLEHDQPLAESDRLRFARDELPPPFDPAAQLRPPADQWDGERLAKARRNYGLEYVRNGLAELIGLAGMDTARDIGGRAARLIGLQGFQGSAARIGAVDGNLADAADYLGTMLRAMGDQVDRHSDAASEQLTVTGLRVARDLAGLERQLLLDCWVELWRGTLASQRQIKTLTAEDHGDHLCLTIRPLNHR